MAAPHAENVIWTIKPSLLSIFTRQFFFLLTFSAMVIALAVALSMSNAEFIHTRSLILWAIVVLLARLVVEILIWLNASFTLTTTTISTRRGVLRKSAVEIPLSKIQHLELFRGVRERLIGAGTIGIGTGAGVEAVLDSVSDPQTVLTSIRNAMGTGTAKRPPVIGLVGSIGAGKSTFANILRDKGCLVLDSDTAAKEVLKRPEVISQITGWWGPGILDESGQIDRRRIADLVFQDLGKRKQLEGLIHPILKTDRAAIIAKAGKTGNITAIIIDAPLLFEAGVDEECDSVICIDAPRELRLERVKSRGWSEIDLARREGAQMSIDVKRKRSDFIVENDSTQQALDVRADEILKQIALKTQ